MAATATAKAKERLERQAIGDYGLTVGGTTGSYKPIDPLATGYGIFGQQYAESLAPTDEISGPLNQIALRHNAEQERTDYDRHLAQAQEYGLALQRQAAATEIGKAILDKEGPSLPGQYHGGTTADGMFGIVADPVIQTTARASELNTREAERFGKTADGYEALRKAGITVTPEMAAQRLTNPFQSAPDTGYDLFPNNVTPTEEAAQTQADASMKKADADMIDANNPKKYSRGSNGELVMTVQGGGLGLPPVTTVKGPASQVAAATNNGTTVGTAPVASAQPPSVVRAFDPNTYDVQTHGTNFVVTNKSTNAKAVYDITGKRVG